MNKIFLILALSMGISFADEFKFDPATDSIDDLYKFCIKNHKAGVNFGNDNSADQELCNKYTVEALTYYKEQCRLGKKDACVSASNIYYLGFGGIDMNKEIFFEYSKKACELGDATSCDAVGDEYKSKFNGESNKKSKKEYKNQAKNYFKKACDLGYKLSCDSLERF
jgi:TPR repeat protein